MRKLVVLILICSVIFSCQKTENVKKITSPQKFTEIIIQPFNDFSPTDTEYIRAEIAKIYPHVSVQKSVNLPKEAYYRPRNRYRADTIIKKLSNNTEKGFVTLGLTNQDISVTKGKIKDFGVMGLGYRPGKACVASNFRVNKARKNEQHFKVAIHEIGHTQGLAHCPNKTCFMRDAEGGNPTDELVDFCDDCKTFLTSKKWKFN